MNDTIQEWDDWWRAVAHHYQHRMRVHDLGHDHKEVLITRSDRWAHTPEHLPQRKSEEERKAENAERAARRAKSEVRRRCKAMGLDCLLTLTHRENQCDEAICKEHLKEFVRRLRRLIPDFVYVAAFERQQRGAWHVHLAVRRVQSHFLRGGVRVKSFNAVRAVWRSVVGALGGNIDMQRRKRSSAKTGAQLAAYLSKYMTKNYEEGREYQKRYTCSRFKMPEPSVRSFYGDSLKELIQRAVDEYAPAGTQIRCYLVDSGKGFFMTVEPAMNRIRGDAP